MKIWRMRVACWIRTTTYIHTHTHTHTQVVKYLLIFPLQQWLHERASVLRYTYVTVLFTFIVYQLCMILNPFKKLIRILVQT